MKNILILLVILLAFECVQSYNWGHPNYGGRYNDRYGSYGFHNGYTPYGSGWSSPLGSRFGTPTGAFGFALHG
uniref:Uncharacterized protein n=1 Tax=Wuchereria bancrofti TaxID=6293 RepID=A0AAF5PUX8_WUCBA